MRAPVGEHPRPAPSPKPSPNAQRIPYAGSEARSALRAPLVMHALGAADGPTANTLAPAIAAAAAGGAARRLPARIRLVGAALVFVPIPARTEDRLIRSARALLADRLRR